MGRVQDANKIQGLYRIHLAKCSADRKGLEQGLLFIVAHEVAKMTKGSGTLKIGEYQMKEEEEQQEEPEGPYLLVQKSLISSLAPTIMNEQVKKLIQKDDCSRMLYEVAEVLRAKGIPKTDAISRFSRVFDELNGVVGAAPLPEEPLYFYQDPPIKAPLVDGADSTNTLGKRESQPVVDQADVEFRKNFGTFGNFFEKDDFALSFLSPKEKQDQQPASHMNGGVHGQPGQQNLPTGNNNNQGHQGVVDSDRTS